MWMQIAGVVLGGLVIVAGVRDARMRGFGKGLLAALVLGMVLFGLSGQTSIKINGFGVELEPVKSQLRRTVEAADLIAEQVQVAVSRAETANEQIDALTRDLASRRVLDETLIRNVREALSNAPRPDLTRIQEARALFAEVRPL